MDIEIQNKKNEALFKNGKYQFTFIPKLPTEKSKYITWDVLEILD